jgi:tetratricopeptide (TPR) repeat protein
MAMLATAALACSPAAGVRKSPPAATQAMAALNKGIGWYDQGCYQRALEFFWTANERFSSLDQNEGVAASLNGIGNVYRHSGDGQQAEVYLKESLRLYRQINAAQKQVLVLANLAAVCMDAGKLQEAADYLNKAEQLPPPGGSLATVLYTNKGILQTRLKDYAAARKTLLAALSQANSQASPALASLQAALGSLEAETGQLQAALEYYQMALATDRSSGFYRGIADDLDQIGQLYVRQDHPGPALDYLLRSLKIHALLGDSQAVARLLAQCEPLAGKTGQDIQLSRFLADRWLEQSTVHPLCQ